MKTKQGTKAADEIVASQALPAWISVLCGIAAILAVLVTSASDAHADHDADSSKFVWVNYGSADFSWNWDFESETAVRTNVDWPVTLIFHNNATVNTVKNAYLALNDYAGRTKWMQNKEFPLSGTCGGTMWMRLNDASSATGTHWDRDDGIKGGYFNPGLLFPYRCVPGGGEYSAHFRIYADNPTQGGNDKMGYNTELGYWVMATSHLDYDECNYPVDPVCNPLHGWTEYAEDLIAADGLAIWGPNSVDLDSYGMTNLQGYTTGYWDGNHYVNNSGFATKIRVP